MQAADDEIQIFIPGASKRESTDSTNAASDVSMSAVDSTPDSGAIDEVPCSEELHNTSLDISITPKAAASCDDDVCSKTLVDENASVVGIGDGVSDAAEPVSSSCNAQAVAVSEQEDDLADDKFFSASEGESLPLLLQCIMFY